MDSVQDRSPVVAIYSVPVAPLRHRLTRIADKLAYHNDGGDFESYPGPSWSAECDRYEPSPDAEAEDAGFHAGYWRLDASPPGELSSFRRMLWNAGYLEGAAQRRQDDEERELYERDLQEDLSRSALDFMEAVHAVGVIEARREGGAR